jgi:MOSC domain-containing protein YiiM
MTTFQLPTLLAGLDEVRGAPSDAGTVELIVRRPAVDEREPVANAQLCTIDGLIGDNWRVKPTHKTGAPNPDAQLTVMSARAAALIAGERERWALAGDQLYVDFDISTANAPPGTRLRVGTAEIEITAEPHLGCGKFIKRFGIDAQKFVNSPEGRALNCRGINARDVRGGAVRVGDPIGKVS